MNSHRLPWKFKSHVRCWWEFLLVWPVISSRLSSILCMGVVIMQTLACQLSSTYLWNFFSLQYILRAVLFIFEDIILSSIEYCLQWEFYTLIRTYQVLTWNSCEKCDYIKLFMQESERIIFWFSGFWIFKIPLEFFGFLEVLFTKLKEVPKTSTYASNKTVFVTIIFSFFFKDVNHIRQMILFQRKLSRLRSRARLKMVIRWDILRELVCIICVFFPERTVSKGATLASSSIYSIYDTCETH